MERLAKLQLSLTGEGWLLVFWFWPNLQQRELGLDTRKDFLSFLVFCNSGEFLPSTTPVVSGGRGRREEDGPRAVL